MKRMTKRAAVTAILLMSAAGAAGAYGILRYLHGTPVITPRHVTAAPETKLQIDALAEITQYRFREITGAYWADGSTGGVQLTNGGQTLSLGDRTGTLYVSISAVGTAHEPREAVVTVEVSP